MIGGFPGLAQLQLLDAIDRYPGLDRYELAHRAHFEGHQSNLARALIELRRFGWISPLPVRARAQSGRSHLTYETAQAGRALLTALRALGEELVKRLLSQAGTGIWPSRSELPILQLLGSARVPSGLPIPVLIRRVTLGARVAKDAMRLGERKGYLHREQGMQGRCRLTALGRGVLEIYRLTAQGLVRMRTHPSPTPRLKAPPTILQLTALAVLLGHSQGMVGSALRAKMPAHTVWESVLAVLARLREQGWLYQNTPGFYELTPMGRRDAADALARWKAAFGVDPAARRAQRSGSAVPRRLRKRARR